MLWFALLACGTEPVLAEPPDRSAVDPASICNHSACGTVTDTAGAPVKGAWIRVLRSDGVEDEKSELDADGRWVLHMREENSGPRPWKLEIGAPGHVAQTLSVPDPLPEEGATLDVKLAKGP